MSLGKGGGGGGGEGGGAVPRELNDGDGFTFCPGGVNKSVKKTDFNFYC